MLETAKKVKAEEDEETAYYDFSESRELVIDLSEFVTTKAEQEDERGRGRVKQEEGGDIKVEEKEAGEGAEDVTIKRLIDPAALSARIGSLSDDVRSPAAAAETPPSPAEEDPQSRLTACELSQGQLSQGWTLSEEDISSMLDPYVSKVAKKVVCGVCGMRFFNKTKAKSHIENKHVNCFQYKCEYCRSVKSNRLSYECHVRSKHLAKKTKLLPKIRMKSTFRVDKGTAAAPSRPSGTAQSDQSASTSSSSSSSRRRSIAPSSYDFSFVTFLRTILSLRQERSSWHTVTNCAEWLDMEQVMMLLFK